MTSLFASIVPTFFYHLISDSYLEMMVFLQHVALHPASQTCINKIISHQKSALVWCVLRMDIDRLYRYLLPHD